MKWLMKQFVASLIVVGLVCVLTNSIRAADARIDVAQIIDKAAAESVIGEPVKAQRNAWENSPYPCVSGGGGG
jgi:hypothetical protein